MRYWPCTCGHSIQDHGHDPRYPNNTACTVCGCISYDPDKEEDDRTGEDKGGPVLRCVEQ
jgi:hypothetical protein